MGFPELNSDEPVILQAHNIKVKSVAFEAVLTNKRLILVDSKKGLIPPQEILIATISTVEGGENAIRDPILTLAIFSPGGTARQMILTFPREASGERKRERDDWLKALKAQVASSVSSPVVPDPTVFGQQSSQRPGTSPMSPPGNYGAPTQKKKIEITRPTRNIIEPIPSIPRPVETTTLPVGSFCSRCGNRVPPESVFCNLCGTKVTTSPDQPVEAPTVISPAPVPTPQPVVPQVQVQTPPAFGLSGDRKERMLEDVIHSIEPLIEDSVPRRTEAAPLVPRHYPAPLPVAETPGGESPVATPQAETPAQAPSGEPVLTGAAPIIPPPVPPAMPTAPPQKKRNFVAIGVLAIVILAVIGGVVIFMNPFGTTPQDTTITPTVTPIVTTATPVPTPTPTPAVTIETLATPTPEPEVAIPKNGVWLRVIYAGKFGGTYGTPGSQAPIVDRNTGDQFFMVSTVNGPVEASIQKLDGSSDELVLEVYKNGELMKRASTQAPKGIVDFQVDLKPAPTPTPTPSPTVDITPAPTAALNSTANATGTM